jgi:hypothetical protein
MRKLYLFLAFMAYATILSFGCTENGVSNGRLDSSSSSDEINLEVCFGGDFSEPSNPGEGEVANTGACIPPPGQVSPPNGVETCIIVEGKCYICNPERGDDCNNTWLWDGRQTSSDWWFTEVPCSGSDGTQNLICLGFPSAVFANVPITYPTVKCGGNTVTAGITWVPATSALNWTNPARGCYYVTAAANCDGSSKTASCGKLIVNPVPTLTCETLPQITGTVGQTISSPTVRCGTDDVPFNNITWTGAPVWDNPATVATYNNVRATVKSGDCKDKQATCSGTLIVNAPPADQLTCASVTQTVTLPALPSAPVVKCNDNIVPSSSIIWKHSNNTTFNWNSLAAGSYNNINATASCGSSNKTANCTGSVVVLNATPSSSSGGGGSIGKDYLGNDYVTLQSNGAGVKNGWASRYWDGCKQSCSWGGKTQYSPLTGSDRCRACQKNGSSEIAANDNNKSSCDGGNSYTCFDFTPYKVNDNLAYAFAASPTDQCGKCFQLQFNGGFQHGSPKEPHKAINGKTLIVMTSNMGGDVGQGQFDILIPGGGLGIFDSFTGQIGVSKADLGENHGGLLSTCEKEMNYDGSKYKSCLINKCNVFTNVTLKEGCLFYANWFEAAGNPTMIYKEVNCPQYLIDKYKATLK